MYFIYFINLIKMYFVIYLKLKFIESNKNVKKIF